MISLCFIKAQMVCINLSFCPEKKALHHFALKTLVSHQEYKTIFCP
ncbi:MAG: hypothetical protein SOZ73_05835 [Campylobacter sp.]|nr:hypothetical protein [Campylobacter sp.]